MRQYTSNYFSNEEVKSLELDEIKGFILPFDEYEKLSTDFEKDLKEQIDSLERNKNIIWEEILKQMEKKIGVLPRDTKNSQRRGWLFFNKKEKTIHANLGKQLEKEEKTIVKLEEERKSIYNQILLLEDKQENGTGKTIYFKEGEEKKAFFQHNPFSIDLKETSIFTLKLTFTDDKRFINHYFLTETDRIIFIKENFPNIQYAKATNRLINF